MKKSAIKTMLFVFLTCLGTAHATAPRKEMPHLPLDLTGSELRAIYESLPRSGMHISATTLELQPIIDFGKRNLDWLIYINQQRQTPLSFSSAATQTNIPITMPNHSNPTIIEGMFNTLMGELPNEMKSVLSDPNTPFTSQPPIAEADYLMWGRKVDRVYQRAVRWVMLEPYIFQLTAARARDIRGYYFLSRMEDRQAKLDNYANLSPEEQTQIREWLAQMCGNTVSLFPRDCNGLVNRAVSRRALNAFYQSYEAQSRTTYESFFAIPSFAARSDIQMSATSLNIPFVDPQNMRVRNFLSMNIEDEWHLGDWQLHLNFVPSGSSHAHVVFESGVVPHVNRIGGSEITMDANAPLEEYDVQWTIRHEFGHVLGLPDCYAEFYESESETIVNYQIDVDNLMCARTGHLQAAHVSELMRVYGRR